MRIPLIPPFWVSLNVSRGPYSFCLNPHIGLFWSEQKVGKGAKGVTIPVSRKIVSFIDKYRFPATVPITEKTPLKELKILQAYHEKTAKALAEMISKKEELEQDTFSNPRQSRAPRT